MRESDTVSSSLTAVSLGADTRVKSTMRSVPLDRLRAAWPLWLPGLACLIGLAADGFSGGVIASTLTFLVVGPTYLVRQWWLRRRGRIPPTAPPTPAQQALVMRLWVVGNALLGLAALVAAAERGDWLHGRGWSAFLVVLAICGLGSAPYTWAAAAEVETGRMDRRAMAVVGICDLVVALGLVGFAAANHWADWLSGAWTVGLAVFGATWIVAGAGCFARLRAPVT